MSILNQLLLLIAAILISFSCPAQTPNVQSKLTATTMRQPAKPNDTIAYKAEITNLGDSTIFNLHITRAGDPNTTLVAGSFESTPVAVPASFASLKEDQLVTLALVGVDPDGDVLDFQIIQPPQQGTAGGIASISNTQASLIYQPNANFSGTDQFTFSVEDEQGNRDTSAVMLSILSVNDAPSFTTGADINVKEDAGLQTFQNWATNINPGPADEASQNLIFHILNNTNADLFVIQPSLSVDGTLSFEAKNNTSGMATIVLQLQDNGGTAMGGIDTSARVTLNIAVSSVNDAPSFTPGANISTNEDAGLQTIIAWATNLNAGPADESSQSLMFHILNNDNTNLFEQQPVLTINGTLSFEAKADANGIATVELQLKDNGGTAMGGIDTSARVTLQIEILPINDAPAFTPGPDITSREDAGTQIIPDWATGLTEGPANEIAQSLEFRILNNSNPNLFFVQPEVMADGTLSFTTAGDSMGIAIIELQLMDNGGTANGGIDTAARHTLQITVLPVNDPPSFTSSTSIGILEDAGAQVLTNWATNLSTGPPDEIAQMLEFQILSNTNPDLFLALPTLTSSGTLSFTAKENENGIATLLIQLKDDGGTANGGVDTSETDTLLLTINAVNDAPSFTKGGDIVITTDTIEQVFENWATEIKAGPTNEQTQVLTFLIESVDNPGLFVETPTITADGTLRFKPAPDAIGVAMVTIRLKDDGGIVNGGIDLSDIQIFSITLEAN